MGIVWMAWPPEEGETTEECQRAKYGHKILLFSSSLTIPSLHFPFLMPLRLTLMILLMLSLFTHDFRTGTAILLVYERQDRYWYKRTTNAY